MFALWQSGALATLMVLLVGIILALLRLRQHPSRFTGVALVLVAVAGTMAPHLMPEGDHRNAVAAAERLHWPTVAALTALTATVPKGRKPKPSLVNLLPLCMVGHQGAGALIHSVAVAGSGSLDPTRPRRVPLLLSGAALALAHQADTHSLGLWVFLGQQTSLSQDTCSLLVDNFEQVLRAGGLALFLVWSLRHTRPTVGPNNPQ